MKLIRPFLCSNKPNIFALSGNPARGLGGKTASLAGALAVLLLSMISPTCHAEDGSTNAPDNSMTTPDSSSSSNPVIGYFADWFKRASKTQAEQPHWVTPLVTVTPRLEQEYRYDQLWQTVPGDHTVVSYGGGKGLELIPAERVEVIIGVPAWQTENDLKNKSGWTDQNFLIK